MGDLAIVVKNAMKKYPGAPKPVLDDLNLTVPKGCIYGLLGASGCGKTTLLSCVVGVRDLDSGFIWVLGGQPGSKISGVPGPRVGYMPQDVSLVDEFSTLGALYFFGRINGMEDDMIEKEYAHLNELLQLPPKDRLVKEMSGGQQRRVSFAAALLHKPELLILDEPTVGLDPILRENIWNYLEKIAREESITVVITTHYIEEAKQANKIGLLRGGKLLAESSPQQLLDRFQTDSLEEAFFKLSEMQTLNQHVEPSNSSSDPSTTSNELTNVDPSKSSYTSKSSAMKRCRALFIKNTLQYVRYPGGILFSLFLPFLQLSLFFKSIGLDPHDVNLQIVNYEAGNCDHGRYLGNVMYNATDDSCHFVDLSCRFIAGINKSLDKIFYDSYEEADRDSTRLSSTAIMKFHQNFSSNFQRRMESISSASESVLVNGQIDVSLRSANRQIAVFVHKTLYENFLEDFRHILKECHVYPQVANPPIHFEPAIYGSNDSTYLDYIAPTFILVVLFVLATSVSSTIIISDRHSGVWDRILVQGVNTSEILLTHIIVQAMLIVIQVTVALCIFFVMFSVECKGSMAVVISMSFLEGICGMLYGLLISVLFTSHTLVNYVSVGSFYPLILLCGMIWPIEGMPPVLRWFSMIMPVTLPGISMRGILIKGASLAEPEVYTGFLVMLGWIAIFISVCLFQLRTKGT
ncbi:ABC transporter G family member 20 [Xylocopa sonorina]|uniref:ABC transporter G family member 20 n=1 Tax=Xylocopa sonorina TaxID=1818115 RepID=UPI00403A968D